MKENMATEDVQHRKCRLRMEAKDRTLQSLIEDVVGLRRDVTKVGVTAEEHQSCEDNVALQAATIERLTVQLQEARMSQVSSVDDWTQQLCDFEQQLAVIIDERDEAIACARAAQSHLDEANRAKASLLQENVNISLAFRREQSSTKQLNKIIEKQCLALLRLCSQAKTKKSPTKAQYLQQKRKGASCPAKQGNVGKRTDLKTAREITTVQLLTRAYWV